MTWKIFNPLLSRVAKINSAISKLVELPAKIDDTFVKISKIFGATAGTAGLGKGTVDFAEAVICKDGVCAFVSLVGCTADSLQIAASFIPGPNITSMVTTPVSVGCKVFVFCCKRSIIRTGIC